MKKIIVLVILATFLTLVLPACGSSNIATADQTAHKSTIDLATPDQPPKYTKDPSLSDHSGKNDDPAPGPYWGNN